MKYFLPILLVLATTASVNAIIPLEQPQELVIDSYQHTASTWLLQPETLNQINSSLVQTLRHLTETIGDRYYSTPNNEMTREWVKDQLTTRTFGKMVVTEVGTWSNIVGVVRGSATTPVRPAIVFSTNYDSPDGLPGADSNAAGVALLLDLAKVLSSVQARAAFDFYFCFTNGRETNAYPGTYWYQDTGGVEVASYLRTLPLDVKCVFSIDQTLYGRTVLYHAQYDSKNPQEFVHMTKGVAKNFFDLDLLSSKNEGLRSPNYTPKEGDHRYYRQVGFPTIWVGTDEPLVRNPHWHSGRDTWDNPDYNLQNLVNLERIFHMVILELCFMSLNDCFLYSFYLTPGESILVPIMDANDRLNVRVGVNSPTKATETPFSLKISQIIPANESITVDMFTDRLVSTLSSDNMKGFWENINLDVGLYKLEPTKPAVIDVLVGSDQDNDGIVDAVAEIMYDRFFTPHDLNPPKRYRTKTTPSTEPTNPFIPTTTVNTYHDTGFTTFTEDVRGYANGFGVLAVILGLFSLSFTLVRRKRRDCP